MSNDSEHGPALYAFLEAEWAALGTNQNAWSWQHGLQGPTVSRWARGTEPSFAAMRAVAHALGRPMLDVLVAAKMITEDEAGGVTTGPTAAPSIDVAIERDPTLTDWEREQLRSFRGALHAVEARTVAESKPTKRDRTDTKRVRA
jgi:hypothetical protein